MKRLLAAGVVALALTGSAGADTFTLIRPTGPTSLPSALAPNPPGSVFVPPGPPAGSAEAGLPLTTLRQLWTGAGAAYGVPWQVLAAINKIESNFGRNMGPSSAGAVGWMQFMPDTWLRWGVDADGNGLADPWNAADAIYAAARYLAASGAQSDVRGAIFSYNHAEWYVNEVLALAALYGQGGVGVIFTLDHLQVAVDDARKQVAAANERLLSARGDTHRRVVAERRMFKRAARARLLSTKLVLEQRAARLTARRVAAERLVKKQDASLAAAQRALSAAREQMLAPSFSYPVASVLGAPAYSGDYVFPVGGGPAVASVGHAHHDYPAADIAAPTGAPVYALAEASVVRAWREPDPRCGIGLTIDTADGQSWTYCHLSYLDDGIEAGTRLQAGASIGLVGATGDATGPHLHLQLNPSDRYPQDEAWFQSFAGRAFRWQDAPTLATAAAAPVFTVVPQPVVKFQLGVVYFSS